MVKKKKKGMLFQEVKDLVRVLELRTISLASKQKGRNI